MLMVSELEQPTSQALPARGQRRRRKTILSAPALRLGSWPRA